MDNLIGQKIDEKLRTYDLKGSMFQRITQSVDSGAIQKDQNFLTNKMDRIRVDPKIQRDITSRIEKDKEFLKSCFLMDYSLLLIFYKKKKQDEERGKANLNRGVSLFIRKDESGNFIEVQEEV